MSHTLHWQLQQQARSSRQIVWLCSGLLLALLGWAAFATLDEVVVGEGKVVPSAAISKIQSFEGGIVSALYVKVGQQVKAGDQLMLLDDTRFRSAFQESQQQRKTFLSQIARLTTELASVIVDPSQSAWQQQVQLKIQPLKFTGPLSQIEHNAQANYQERMNQLRSNLEEARLFIEQQSQAFQDARNNSRTLGYSLKLVEQEVAMLEDVVANGSVARVELLKLQRDQVQLQGDIASSRLLEQKLSAALSEAIVEYRNIAIEFRTKAQGQLNDISNQLAQLNESQRTVADQLRRTVLTAPVSGTIKEVLVRSIGGVIRPGEPIMEIVPRDSGLLIETKIAPQDIAFIRTGLPATIKFTAYDFVIYGGQAGTVTYVSADALQDEDGSTYYRAHIKLNDKQRADLEMIPGMQATVDILTGEKTVLSYWLKPLLRAKASALRER